MTEPRFRAKGLVFMAAREHYARVVPGGLATYEQRLTPELRIFFRQGFYPSGWFDVLPIVPLSLAAANAAGLSHRELVMSNARYTAQRDMNGAYKLLLKFAPPATVAARLPRIAMQYFSFGTAEGEVIDRRLLRATQLGVPTELVQWLLWAVEGFAPVVLSAAGAKDIQITSAPGEAHSDDTSTIRWTMGWR